MKKISIAALIFSIIILACDTSADAVKFDAAPIQTGADLPTTSTTLPGTKDSNQSVQNNLPLQPNINSIAPALNPEHGKPGHRCDIAVGAPLNSVATTPAASATSTTIPVNTPAAIKPSIGVKLNPEHGKPGHRCDIAVGAPLTAAAGTPSATAISPTLPANIANATVPTGAVKLNPEHGKPGHDCTIAVGQPLKQ